MQILCSQPKSQLQADNLEAIILAAKYCKLNVSMLQTPFLDLRKKPDFFIGHDFTEEELEAAQKFDVQYIYIKDYYANPFYYTDNVEKNSDFKSDITCINDYGTIDSIKEYLDVRIKNVIFKLFQPEIVAYKAYQGYYKKEYHSGILKSANSVLCTHDLSRLNTLLINESIIDTVNIIYKKWKTRHDVLNECTSFSFLKNVVGFDNALSFLDKLLKEQNENRCNT